MPVGLEKARYAGQYLISTKRGGGERFSITVFISDFISEDIKGQELRQ